MKQRAFVLLLVAAGGTALCWSRSTSTPAAGKASAVPASAAPLPIQWQGSASCAASACHNGNGPRDLPGSEYTTWIANDRHAKAYQVLFDKASHAIVKNLRLGQQAHEAALCLNCHVHPHFDKAQHSPQFSRMDGVGCESCHGPAQHWIGEHYRAGKRDLRGMRDTKSLLGRVQVCVACHVGTAESDVNHDLIAAGHPRLNFEFGAYHANMQRHWSDARDKEGRADFEARAWVVGQMVTARAALELLAHRAEGKASQPWPELAELNCYACHHDLTTSNWRQKGYEENKKRIPGALLENEWYLVMLPHALAATDSRTRPQLVAALKDIKTEIEKGAPARKRIADMASQAAQLLATDLDRTVPALRQPLPVHDLFGSLRKQERPEELTSWDHAAQSYLALAAFYNAMSDMSDSRFTATPEPRPAPGLKTALDELRKTLRFPPAYASPRDFHPGKGSRDR